MINVRSKYSLEYCAADGSDQSLVIFKIAGNYATLDWKKNKELLDGYQMKRDQSCNWQTDFASTFLKEIFIPNN